MGVNDKVRTDLNLHKGSNLSYLVLFCSCVFSPFSIAITWLVWFCLFPLSLGVWEGLRFMTVAHTGLFSYLFGGMGVYAIERSYTEEGVGKI